MTPRQYIVAGVFVIVLMYVIPYVFFNKARDASLFTYWMVLSLIWIIISIIYLYRGVKE